MSNVHDVTVDGIQYVPIDSEVPPVAVGIPLIDKVVMPMKNIGKAWYEATRVYGPYNYHPYRCEDWNLETGGNTDLGEPLVAPFSGLVTGAHDYGGGTGKVVQIIGRDEFKQIVVWSGWHLEGISVDVGQIVIAGDDIGTIGDADGRYAGAHLHEQICIVNFETAYGIPAPQTFAANSNYAWQQPSEWYKLYIDSDEVERVANKDGA